MKAGYWVEREGKHIIMTNGTVDLVIPRHNPVNGYAMGGLIVTAGLTVPQFRNPLRPVPAGNAGAPYCFQHPGCPMFPQQLLRVTTLIRKLDAICASTLVQGSPVPRRLPIADRVLGRSSWS